MLLLQHFSMDNKLKLISFKNNFQDLNSNMDSEENVRRRWTTEETRAFLAVYARRKDEEPKTRNKRDLMALVLEDLISQAALTQPTTVEMLSAKLKNLIRGYRIAQQNGTLWRNVPFSEELGVLFGDRPSVAHEEFMDAPLTPPDVKVKVELVELAPVQEPAISESVQVTRKRKLGQADYYEEKLRLQKEFYDRKLQMLQEAEESRQKRHEEKMVMLKEVLFKLKSDKN